MGGYKISASVVRSQITEAHGRVARGLIWILTLKVPVTAVRRTSSRKVKRKKRKKRIMKNITYNS